MESLDQRDWKEAIEYLERALELDDEPSASKRVDGVFTEPYFPYYYLGVAYQENGQLETARNALTQALDHDQLKETDKSDAERRLERIIDTVHPYEAGVVKITSRQNGIGTGFVVRIATEGVYILTAEHVIDGDEHPEVEFFNGARGSATVSRRNNQHDLALLLLERTENNPQDLLVLPLANPGVLAVGDGVTALGFPLVVAGLVPIQATIMRIPRPDAQSKTDSQLVLRGPFEEGNSGGPVLKDQFVIGLVTGAMSRLAYATSASDVQLFLDESGVERQQ